MIDRLIRDIKPITSSQPSEIASFIKAVEIAFAEIQNEIQNRIYFRSRYYKISIVERLKITVSSRIQRYQQ